MQVKKQQLEPDIEPWTGLKLGKKYVKVVYCHPAYLTYMQSTLCEMPSWMNTSGNHYCREKYQQPQICRWYYCNAEKAMAPHSSTLAWKIPWTEEPGRLQPTGSRRVGHDWATSLSLFTFMHWRRKWQPTPVYLPGESQGQGSLMTENKQELNSLLKSVKEGSEREEWKSYIKTQHSEN